MSDVTHIFKIDEARAWAVTLLRETAVRLETVPAPRAADALLVLAGTLTELERQAARVLPA